MKNIDEQIVSDEVFSITNYIIKELDYQINGSYIAESVPKLEEQVYRRLISKLRARLRMDE